MTLPSARDSNKKIMPKGPDHKPAQPQARRFWWQTPLLFVPPIITAYFWFIWGAFLRRDFDYLVPYGNGRVNELVVNYSWTIISVFALGWSKDYLLGVEAAMLGTSYWEAPDFACLLKHHGSSWTGRRSWVKHLWNLLARKKKLVHGLWELLALLSFFAFVAVPLSGLSLKLSDGYVPSQDVAMVIGRTWADFNQRQLSYSTTGLANAWRIGSSASVPGFGIIYTPENVQRKNDRNFENTPNTLHKGENFSEIFLGPQAESPIAGMAWGLHAGYECSVVNDTSNFTIISQKRSSTLRRTMSSDEESLGWKEYAIPSGQMIYTYNTFSSLSSTNIIGYVEIGASNGLSENIGYDGSEPRSLFPNDSNNWTTEVLEMSIWQALIHPAYKNIVNFNDTLEPVIQGMDQPITQSHNGSYVINDSFFQIFNGSQFDSEPTLRGALSPLLPWLEHVAPPIGIRCSVISNLGTANINAEKCSFDSFEQTLNPPFNGGTVEARTARLGSVALTTLLGRFYEIFTSVNSRAPVAYSNSYQYESFVQPQMLQKSVILALGLDALQLMYDGTNGFDGARENNNLTSSRPGKILGPGPVKPAIPASFFLVWAAGCTVLGIRYVFCRRLIGSLDGYTLFRTGVAWADKVTQDKAYFTQDDYLQVSVLRDIPGILSMAIRGEDFGPHTNLHRSPSVQGNTTGHVPRSVNQGNSVYGRNVTGDPGCGATPERRNQGGDAVGGDTIDGRSGGSSGPASEGDAPGSSPSDGTRQDQERVDSGGETTASSVSSVSGEPIIRGHAANSS